MYIVDQVSYNNKNHINFQLIGPNLINATLVVLNQHCNNMCISLLIMYYIYCFYFSQMFFVSYLWYKTDQITILNEFTVARTKSLIHNIPRTLYCKYIISLISRLHANIANSRL
jgi:hypothetical protein